MSPTVQWTLSDEYQFKMIADIPHETPATVRQKIACPCHLPQEWAQHREGVTQAFEDIEKHGFCSVAGAWRSSLAAVAVPLGTPINGMSLAFNLTVPSHGTTSQDLYDDLGPRLLALVQGIEAMLGE